MELSSGSLKILTATEQAPPTTRREESPALQSIARHRLNALYPLTLPLESERTIRVWLCRHPTFSCVWIHVLRPMNR